MDAPAKIKRPIRPLLLVLLAALLFTGLGIFPATAYAKPKAHAAKTSRMTKATNATKAKKIALKRVGGGKVTKCRVDYDDGRKEYDIVIVWKNKKYSMEVRAGNGRISDYKVKKIKTSPSAKVIGAAKAKRIALDRTGCGRVVDCDLDYEHGYRVYEIEIRDGRWEYELDIDAYSGKIRKCHREYEDDWDD